MNKEFDSVEFQRKRREELSRKLFKFNDQDILRFFNYNKPMAKQVKKAA
jgi:hypothetical protein